MCIRTVYLYMLPSESFESISGMSDAIGVDYESDTVSLSSESQQEPVWVNIMTFCCSIRKNK